MERRPEEGYHLVILVNDEYTCTHGIHSLSPGHISTSLDRSSIGETCSRHSK